MEVLILVFNIMFREDMIEYTLSSSELLGKFLKWTFWVQRAVPYLLATQRPKRLFLIFFFFVMNRHFIEFKLNY